MFLFDDGGIDYRCTVIFVGSVPNGCSEYLCIGNGADDSRAKMVSNGQLYCCPDKAKQRGGWVARASLQKNWFCGSYQQEPKTYHCRHLEVLLDAHLDPGPPLSKRGLLLGLLLIHLRVRTYKRTNEWRVFLGIARSTRQIYSTR